MTMHEVQGFFDTYCDNFAHLQWTPTGADGSLLQEFHTGYQLMRTGDGLKPLLAVAHEERIAPKQGRDE
jgi:hypothetical protein